MEAVIGLLLMLLRVSNGVETCDGRQNGSQCYGALGGTVVLQLMDSASEIFRYQLLSKTTVILTGRKNQILSKLIENRSSFTPINGTFRINKLSWTDGGEYTLEIFDSNGQRSEQRTLHLTIQAPVTSVLLVSECLSQGEMRVSCSSEGGDSPQYSWTLDGHTLTDAQLLSGNNESNNITLKQDVSGQLVCSARNNVSSVSKKEKISTCGFIFINCTINMTHISQWVLEASNTLCIEPATTPTMITDTARVPSSDVPWYISNLPVIAGVLSALLILLLVGVAVACAHKKQENNRPKEEEDEQELTTADVRVVQLPGRQQREEVEVEYSQVKISQRPRQAIEPTRNECVYAKVRRGS
ncbi:T-cell surface antigen CD2-like isoform X2 [Micropterus dolomieu]|uniref:T-cell surface antigen CD2-like isoform X2 n=1 Tax=Micropterus dolomieu TaxID=147949 RepID=UPI001E8CB3E0|nr:T-cell surface antigen CD2-like isoform X2 [Micropterus dolomieu]